jgi:hypothetical protein
VISTEQHPDDRITIACKRIHCAIVMQAIEDLFSERKINPKDRASAEAYLFSTDSDYAFKVLSIDGDSKGPCEADKDHEHIKAFSRCRRRGENSLRQHSDYR